MFDYEQYVKSAVVLNNFVHLCVCVCVCVCLYLYVYIHIGCILFLITCIDNQYLPSKEIELVIHTFQSSE